MIKHNRMKGRSRGHGISNFLKPVISLVNKALEYKDVAKDVVNLGKNTKDIIKEMKTKNTQPTPARAVNEVENIVSRINRIRLGGSTSILWISLWKWFCIYLTTMSSSIRERLDSESRHGSGFAYIKKLFYKC